MKKMPKMNRLSKKISKKIGLSQLEVDSILKVTSFELVEILKKEQRFYWQGLGVFYLAITDTGLSVRLKLSDDIYDRLNKKDGETTNEIIFE